jgi:glycosyltransferase involved in cell wall biosynthesis
MPSAVKGMQKEPVSDFRQVRREGVTLGKRRLDVLPEEVTVVIPTLNEEKAIGDVIREIKEAGYSKILVVDGHSTDRTRDVAEGLGAAVLLQDGVGKTKAIESALGYVDTEFLLVMDGDWTYPASHIAPLTKLLSRYDEAIGWRKEGRSHIPFFNRLGDSILSKEFSLLFSTGVHDVCSGMYAFRTSVAGDLFFESRGFSTEVEMAAQVASAGGHLTELPIAYRERKGRRKMSPIRHGPRIAMDILRLSWNYSPVVTLGAIASLLLAPGAIIGVFTAYDFYVNGVKHVTWAIIGAALLGTGLIALSTALLSLQLRRIELRLRRAMRAPRNGGNHD